MQIRDRITELRRVRAGDLTPSPQNWREHPESQRKALAAILGEVGYADACLTYTAPDGRLTLFDGHLRQSLDPDQIVPCLVTDLTEAEARKMMAVLDPLAGMAEANAEKLAALIAEIETESADVKAMLEQLAAENPTGNGNPTELKNLNVQRPPKMTWALIGIPTVRFGEIAETMERLAAVDGLILETISNDG